MLLIVSHPLEQGPEGWLFFQMRGALAEYERAKIIERTRRGHVGRIQAGHPGGGNVPLGYRSIAEPHGGRWEADEHEAALVRRIFALCLAGQSTRKIARILTAERVPTPSDRHPERGHRKRLPYGVWNYSSLQAILRYQSYIGVASWGKRGRVSGTRRQTRQSSEWVTFAVPPIIDESTFDAAQQALRRHQR
jgi:site-specific DNA recombinase